MSTFKEKVSAVVGALSTRRVMHVDLRKKVLTNTRLSLQEGAQYARDAPHWRVDSVQRKNRRKADDGIGRISNVDGIGMN